MGVGAEQRHGRGRLADEFARVTAERRARARAVFAAAGLEDALTRAGDRASRLAEELLQASRANRELVETLIGEEVARAADRWGFVRSEELEELRREVDELRVALVKATLQVDNDPADSDEPAKMAPKQARKRASRSAAATDTAKAGAGRQQHPLGGVAPEAVAPDAGGDADAGDDSSSRP